MTYASAEGMKVKVAAFALVVCIDSEVKTNTINSRTVPTRRGSPRFIQYKSPKYPSENSEIPLFNMLNPAVFA